MTDFDRRRSSGSAAGPDRTADPARAGVSGTPGKTTLTSQLPVAPVQQRAAGNGGGGAGAVPAAAAHGVSGPGGGLPYRDRIQAAFGRHDVSHIQAHSDDAAREGATAMGAQAFATGDHVAFAGAPDLHTAAHEAAHVVQQRAGVHLRGGVGEAGDAYERHADAVADRVVRGESAEALLDVGAADHAAAGPAVQRKIPHQVAPSSERSGVRAYIDALDAATQKAYMYVLHVPMLGPYKDLDGYTQQWVETWEQHTRGQPHPMMAAHFGYAVESLTTLVYLPAPPSGMITELQGPRGATRPDVILKDGTTDVAWLDLTAEASAGHIWNKAGWDRASHHLAEITYPSMNVVHFNPTDGYKDGVDGNEFLRRRAWAERIMRIRQETWHALGLRFKAKRGGDPVIREATLPAAVVKKLSAYFHTPVDRATAASVLTVMGVDPMTHCLIESVSRARGTAFLMQNDPNLPSIEIPPDGGVPRGLIPHDYAQMLSLLQRMEADGSLDAALGAEATDSSLVEDDAHAHALAEHGGGQSEGALAAPVREFQFTLPDLRLPPAVFSELNQFLHDHSVTLALDLQNGPARGQLVAEPGAAFASSLQALFAELEAQDREDGRPRDRQRARARAWDIRMGFVRQPRQRALRGVDPQSPRWPAPSDGPMPEVAFQVPPFLQLLMAPPQPRDDGQGGLP